jgi:hypothetical protein
MNCLLANGTVYGKLGSRESSVVGPIEDEYKLQETYPGIGILPLVEVSGGKSMRHFKFFLLVFCLGLFVTALQSNAIAGPDHRSETLTFNQPVEIPGMVLLPGTYDFRYLSSDGMPGVVLISDNQGKLLKEVLAESAYREKVTGKTVVTFEKLAPNAPEAIKDWFYPGESIGVAFVYPNHIS